MSESIDDLMVRFQVDLDAAKQSDAFTEDDADVQRILDELRDTRRALENAVADVFECEDEECNHKAEYMEAARAEREKAAKA